MRAFQNYHRHSMYTNIKIADSTAKNEDYAKRAQELGHGIISSVEHGFQGRYIEGYELAKQYGLKFLFGTEAYWVKDRFEKDRTNAHVILLAKNENGRQAINDILAEANITGYYYQPRLDLSLILSLPKDDVWVTTACVAFWRYDDDQIIIDLHNHFGRNFFLEVQYHNTESQKELNKKIINLANRYNIQIIMGCDSHYISEEKSWERDEYIKSSGIVYEDEQGWYLDYPDGDTAFNRFVEQGILTKAQIEDAIANTNTFLQVEEYNNPCFTKDIKMPSLYPHLSQEEKDKLFCELIWWKWEQEKEKVPIEKHEHYVSEIQKELDTIIVTKHADYFLLDYELVRKAKNKGGVITPSGRGSGASFYVNKLLGFTKIDRISASVKMYPERFMSATRILESKSLVDLDLNLANPEVFFEAQKELLGEQSAYQMLAYGTMKTKSAWKMYARAKGIDAETANVVSEQIEKYETKLKHAEEDEKDDIDLMDFVEEQYHEYMNDSLQYRGIIAQISPHPCASLLYSGNIRKEIGLILVKSTSGKKETLCTIMDGKWAEDYKFLKNDLLKVNVVDVIDKVFKKIGMEIPDENELIQMCDGVQSVWDVYGRGFTLGINQVEQNSTRHRVMKYKPKNISELSAFVAAVRPGFKSMYSIFEARERFDYGIPVFDDLIQTKEMPNSFLLYQEMSMAALNFAGIQMSECYEVVKNISKKRVEKVTKYKKQFLEGFSKKIVEVEHRTNQEAHDIADKVWQIIEDSTRYQFNASHSYSVAMDSLYGAWLKSQHPLAFYEVFLTVLDEKGSKDRMKAVRAEAENAYKIRFAPLRFRQDNRKITSDEATNSIWGTLKSIKGFGTAIADQMYSMKDMKFDSFVDFLIYIEENGIMCSKIEDLIKVQYFSEFGGGQKLLTIYKEFSNGKNCYDKKHKTETKAKRLIALYEFELSLADENFPLIQQMEMEQEILGYTQVVMPIDKKFVFVQDINTTYAPRVEVYCLANAKTESMKIDRRTFGSKPIELHDILLLKKWKSKPQIKYVNGKYEPACGNPFHKSSCKGCAEADGCSMKEWWIEDYDIRNDIKTNT